MIIETDTSLVESFFATLQPGHPSQLTPVHVAHRAFTEWCLANGVDPDGIADVRTFGRQTSRLGMRKHRTALGKAFVGISLRRLSGSN
jgi:hypothetical protein